MTSMPLLISIDGFQRQKGAWTMSEGDNAYRMGTVRGELTDQVSKTAANPPERAL
jgi:hypothetical protein